MSEDEAGFYSKNPLHKQLDAFADTALRKTLKNMDAGGRMDPNKSSNQRFIEGVLADCIPLHGEARCKPAATEFAEYNTRQKTRILKRLHYQCDSRGFG